jgi:hypothetical protein
MRDGGGVSRAGALLRGFSGVLAGGLVWHSGAAVAAVLVQRQADRRPGVPGVSAALAVLLITTVLLTVQWLV